MHDTYFAWTTLEHAPKDRTADWYWAVGIIAVSAAAGSILLGNILFAILIILGTISLILFTRQAPKELHIEITKAGIIVDNELYRYENLESYWVTDHGPEHYMLTIKSKRLIMPYVSFPVSDDIHSEDLRDVLGAYLPEEEYVEPLSQKVMEYLGF